MGSYRQVVRELDAIPTRCLKKPSGVLSVISLVNLKTDFLKFVTAERPRNLLQLSKYRAAVDGCSKNDTQRRSDGDETA